MKTLFSLTNLTLLVALSLSAVAAYYSIIGLTAIFAGAIIPIIIMGTILEIGKITTTVWLRKYWKKCSFALKLYLVPAVVLLAVLTSMGIFGFLSKAHTEVGLISGDSQARLAIIDEKIKTQRENIELARKALQQLDAQVDTRLARGNNEQSVERAVTIRRQQATERIKLQKEISDSQEIIAKLNEERAPIAAEARKIEAEVGPIKYIAALIYEDNPSAELLERAVRWVIILLVIVFDPLAIALVLAANASKEWDKQEAKDNITKSFVEETNNAHPEVKIEDTQIADKKEPSILEQNPYLATGFKYPENYERVHPLVYKSEPVAQSKSENSEIEVKSIPEEELITSTMPHSTPSTTKINSSNAYKEVADGYVIYDDKMISKDALKEIKPELFLEVDNVAKTSTNFGTHFPKFANKGDVFVRVDVLPNKVFKFDGARWFELNKNNTSSYLTNDEYVKFLISKIEDGQYDVDHLTDAEKEQIESYLKSRK
jgi:hypothetical protein